MSVLLGIFTVIFLALGKINKKFYFGCIVCIALFIVMLATNDNKFLDFVYFFFATGITQILLVVLFYLKKLNL